MDCCSKTKVKEELDRSKCRPGAAAQIEVSRSLAEARKQQKERRRGQETAVAKSGNVARIASALPRRGGTARQHWYTYIYIYIYMGSFVNNKTIKQ